MHHSELNIFRNKSSKDTDRILLRDATEYNPKYTTVADVFITFLNDHCIKDEFEKNLKEHRRYNSLNELMKEKHPQDWIMFSFPWSKHSRTYDFWSELNRNWKKRINYDSAPYSGY